MGFISEVKKVCYIFFIIVVFTVIHCDCKYLLLFFLSATLEIRGLITVYFPTGISGKITLRTAVINTCYLY